MKQFWRGRDVSERPWLQPKVEVEDFSSQIQEAIKREQDWNKKTAVYNKWLRTRKRKPRLVIAVVLVLTLLLLGVALFSRAEAIRTWWDLQISEAEYYLSY